MKTISHKNLVKTLNIHLDDLKQVVEVVGHQNFLVVMYEDYRFYKSFLQQVFLVEVRTNNGEKLIFGRSFIDLDEAEVKFNEILEQAENEGACIA